MRKTIATLIALAALALAPSANAGYGDDYDVMPINSAPVPTVNVPALPDLDGNGAFVYDRFFWAGVCDRSEFVGVPTDTPIPGGFGKTPITVPTYNGTAVPAPANPKHCIDWQIATTSPSPTTLWSTPPRFRAAPVVQAGAHPDGSTAFAFGGTGTTDNIVVKLPAGVVANPNAVAKCSAEQFDALPYACPPESQIGVLNLRLLGDGLLSHGGNIDAYSSPVYNLEPREGNVAELGLVSLTTWSALTARVVAKARTSGDYGVTAFVGQVPSPLPVQAQSITLWGVPWAAHNDIWRIPPGTQSGNSPLGPHCTNNFEDTIPAGGLPESCQQRYKPSWGPIEPFFTLESECSPDAPVTTLYTDAYQVPGDWTADGAPIGGKLGVPNAEPDESDGDWKRADAPAPPVEGCDKLEFDPGIALDPVKQGEAANEATDSPTGLDVELTIPQNNDLPFNAPPEGAPQGEVDNYVTNAFSFWDSDAGLATAHLKDTTVTLAEGMTLNPAAAGGQGSCTMDQMGLVTTDARSSEIQVVSSNANEVQTVTVDATGGFFNLVVLTPDAEFTPRTTGGIAPGATAAQVQGQLENLPNLTAGHVAVTGPMGGPWQVEFKGKTSGRDVPLMTTENSLTGGSSTVTVATVPRAFTITFDGETTDPIAVGASHDDVLAALEALPNVGDGDVSGQGHEYSRYRITFSGGLARQDVAEMTADPVADATGAPHTTAVKTLEKGGKALSPAIRFDNAPVTCPDNSKVGEVVIETPLLDEADWPTGEVYLATQGANPFGSDFAIYIVIQSKQRGFVAKLPGKVETDPVTGRLKTTFVKNPELPFDKFKLMFKAGPRAPLATPTTCGTNTHANSFTSHAAPNDPVVVNDSFTLTSSPAGGCPTTNAQRPLTPGFSAGSTGLVAGASSPFTVRLTRPDGNQELDRIEVTTPEGLAAKLAGVPYCPEASIAQAAARTASGDGALEKTNPSCPAASQVGTTTIGAGAGSQPFFVKGNVYFAGPYNGAPVSLAFIVPAVAGPFDLGVQVVRTALRVDPRTAQVTAVSDTIPKLLRGIPLRIRDVRVDIDRDGFTLNPTDCSAQLVKGTVHGANGAFAEVSNRFQIAECARLPFKPSMQLRLNGKTKRASYQGLKAVVTARPGEANIAHAAVTMPPTAFLAQEHIRTVCTRVQFAVDACPAGSIYGRATAQTPLLDYPLTGNVYLRSSSNKLPDLVADLRGPAHQPVKVELVGRTDSVKGALRNTFDLVPDAPVSRFELELFGGSKGLIVNSKGLCGKIQRATVKLTGQNGRTHNTRPVVKNGCKKKGKKKSKSGGRGSRAAR